MGPDIIIPYKNTGTGWCSRYCYGVEKEEIHTHDVRPEHCKQGSQPSQGHCADPAKHLLGGDLFLGADLLKA